MGTTMTSLLIMVASLWALGALVLLLHYYSPRVGFAPYLIVVGAVSGFLTVLADFYIQPFEGFTLYIASSVFVPVILMAVLVLYVVHGGVPARLLIFGVLGINIIGLIIQNVFQWMLSAPGGAFLDGLQTSPVVQPPELRATLASTAAFLVDMFVIAIFYQGVRNYARRLPRWVAVGVALLASLWADAILFRTLGYLGTASFTGMLPNDIIGKSISALALWPLLGYYLSVVAPKVHGERDDKGRPTLDIFFGSIVAVKLALVRTEAALERSEELRQKEAAYFQQIADHINEALWLSTPDQSYGFYVNQAYERIFGRSAARLYTGPLPSISKMHPEDRERIAQQLPAQIIEGYDIEYRIVNPDGSMRWIRDRAFPIKDANGQVYRIAGISEDVTERKEAERRQMELVLERERVKLLRDFISEASHDLKSPLTAINLRVHSLLKTTDEAKRRGYLADVEELSNRMSRMIDDLFTLTRLENTVELSVIRLNIGQVLREVVTSVQALAERKDIALTVDAPEVVVNLYADEGDLTRAFANLVDNAVHYTRNGGTVGVRARTESSRLIIQVTDNGIGISPDDLPRLFTRFFRGDNARALDATGTGLGLAIVKRVIDRAGGMVDVRSEVDKGTTFTITLPLRHA
jgi:PAS domain S-box-containing protein